VNSGKFKTDNMRRFKKTSNNEGFSLTEILLAILIFAITVTPLIQLFIQSTREAESASDFYQAHHLLTIEMEKLKSLASLYPDVFRRSFPVKTRYTKNSGKYSCAVTIDPEFEMKVASAYDGSTIEVRFTEAAAEANWIMTSGKPQKLVYNTTLY